MDVIWGPGPIRHQMNWFRCLGKLSNVRRTTILQFANSSPIVSDESSPAGTSAVVSVDKYCAPQVPRMRSASFGPVVGSSPGRVDSSDETPRRPYCCNAVAAGRRTQFVTSLHRMSTEVMQSVFRSGILPFTIDRRCCAGVTCSSRFHPDSSHGRMAPPGCTECPPRFPV